MKEVKEYFLALICVVTSVSCQQAPQDKTQEKNMPANSWRSLFDGTSIVGWEMVGPGELKLENGELVTYGGMGLLWYPKEKFGNCQIRVLFKITGENDNSGVFIRIPDPPKTPWEAVNRGYEAQINYHDNEYHRTGCLYSLTKAKAIVQPKLGQWSTMLITIDGKRTLVEVDDQLVTDYMEGDPVPEKKQSYEPDRGPRPEDGFIGLQNHNENVHVHFKEVSIRGLKK